MPYNGKSKEQKDNEEYAKNFTRTPNVLFVSYKHLTKEEKYLYIDLRRIYWDARPRYVSLRELSQVTEYSTSALGKMLPRLTVCDLIHTEIRREKDKHGKERGNAKYYITILDIWEFNRQFFSCTPDEREKLDPSLKLVHEKEQACPPNNTSLSTKKDKVVSFDGQDQARTERAKDSLKDPLKTSLKRGNNKPESPQSKKPQETQERKEVPSPSFQQKNTKNVLSEKAQTIITLWEEIEGEPVLLTKKIIDAALALEKVSPTKEQLMECKYFCLTDNTEWYKTHGLDLASIANNWAKWRSKCKLTNANTTRASTTATVRLQAATPGSQYIVDELVSRSEDNLSAWLATPEGQKAMQEAEEEEQRHAQQALTITLSKASVSGMQNFTFEPEPVPVLSNAPRTGRRYIKKPQHAEV